MARGAASVATRFHPGSARSHCPLGACQRPASRTRAGRGGRPVGRPGPLPGAASRASSARAPQRTRMAGAPDGRGPAERVEPRGRPRPLPGEPPGSAESSGFSPGGRTSQAPSELAGAGTAASEIEAEERGRAGEPAAPRPDAAGRWGPQDGSREERGCAAVVSGSYPRRPGGGRRGPGPSGRHEEAKNADHERGVGTWGRAPPRLGSAGADPACEPRDASEPPGPRKRRKGALKSSQGLGSPGSFLEDRLEEQVLSLPVVGRPQQRRFLEIQITGCGRPCRVLLSRGGFYSLLGGCAQQSVKVTLDTHSFAHSTPTVCQRAPRRWADSREQDPQV